MILPTRLHMTLPVCDGCKREITDRNYIVLYYDDPFDGCICKDCGRRIVTNAAAISKYAADIISDLFHERTETTPEKWEERE